MAGSILVVHYETTTGKYLVQKAGSAQISDGAITSGKIASGIVGTVHLRDLNVTSAKLAAALIASIEAGVADGGVTSAKIASGAVGTVHMWPGAVTSAILASGAIGGVHIFSGSIPGADLANQAITSSKVGVGAIGDNLLKNAGVLSGALAADVVGGDKVWAFGVLSGKYASGSITEQALVSGISIDISEIGQEPSYRAGALISAYLGVQFSTSGYFNHARAADVDTMPAVGLAIATIASGLIGTFQHTGRITNPNWSLSGYVGELVFLGTSSQVTLTAPAASGECVQRLGKVIEDKTVFLRPELAFVQLAE